MYHSSCSVVGSVYGLRNQLQQKGAAVVIKGIAKPIYRTHNATRERVPFELIADACGFGIGAALLQEGRPVAYLCRKFSPAECNYGVGEQELLAVVHAMRTWRCYLEGVSADMLTVVTDHNPLTYLQTQTVLSRRQTRWSEYLQMFTFKWQYRFGKSNVADPLSRKPWCCCCYVACCWFCVLMQVCCGTLQRIQPAAHLQMEAVN